MRYGPNVSIFPIPTCPRDCSIQYPLIVCPWFSGEGVLKKSA